MQTTKLLVALFSALLMISCGKKGQQQGQNETSEITAQAEPEIRIPDAAEMKLWFDTDQWKIMGFTQEGTDAYFLYIISKEGSIKPYTIETNYVYELIGDYLILGMGSSEPTLQIIELPTQKETILTDSSIDGIIQVMDDNQGFYFNRRLPDNPHFIWNPDSEIWKQVGTLPEGCDPYAIGLDYVSTRLVPGDERSSTIISILENAMVTFPDCQATSCGTYCLQPEHKAL